MLTARSEDKLKAASDAINSRGAGRAFYMAADLKADLASIHARAVEALGGPIDISWRIPAVRRPALRSASTAISGRLSSRPWSCR
jgi:hypothetical protein